MRLTLISFLFSTLPILIALAQPAPADSPSATTNQSVATSPAPQKSPAADVRRLLAMNDAERQKLLATKSADYRQLVEPKLKELQALSPNERELRLMLIDLRWYLADLMRLPPAERATSLAQIPKAERPLIEDRLRQWDRLPPAEQEQLLTNQMTMSYFLRLTNATPAQRTEFLQNFTDAQQNQIGQSLVQLSRLPEETRRNMFDHFQRFFELNEKEKLKVLAELPDTERQQTEKALDRFRILSKSEREASLVGFRKFMRLAPSEQERLLETAARWQAMPPSERQAWRDVADKLPDMPPLPPGLLPIIPHGLKTTLLPAPPDTATATNR